ncbi:MAG TPA: MFS transporter [Methanoregula sp.]|nr:MFS transporter [Methanoregula sp.]
MPDPRKIALSIAIIAGFLTPFDLSAVNIALPSIGQEFAMDAVSMGWVATAYLLASAAFLLPFGRIADIHGRKRIFVSGLFLFTLASALTLFAPSALLIILLRVMQGIGAAMIFGTAVAILSSVTPANERGTALGIYTTSVYIGLSCGPFIGGFLTQAFGWRSIFFINIPVGLVAIALALLFLKGEWADAQGEPFDLIGAVRYGLALTCIMLGFSLLPETGGALLLGAGCVTGLFFISREKKIRYPLLDLSLWTMNRSFAFSNIAAFINYSATFSVTFFLSLYLQYNRGFDPWTAGAILVIQPVTMAVVSPFAGRLSDRVMPGTIASFGMGLTALGLVALVFVRDTTSLMEIAGILILLGAGLGFFSSPNTNAVMGSVTRKDYGVASSTLGTMRLVGQAMSMGIAMMILALFIGRIQITPDQHVQLASSMQVAFSLFAALCIAGVFLSLVRCRQEDEAS